MPRVKSKYNSKKVIRDGLLFDSKKEADRYNALTILEQTGEISDLQRQVSFLLIPTQYEEVVEYTKKQHKKKIVKKVIEKSVSYKADFVYKYRGETVVEDVKGYKKGAAYAIFTIKRKLMLKEYGIRIREI